MRLESSDRLTRRTIGALAGFNTLTALGGAAGLVGGFLELDPVSTSRLPWSSTVLAGVALLLWVGIPNAVLAVLALRGDARTGTAAVLVGLLVVGWIVVELAFIRTLSFFHPLYLVVGLVLVRCGRHPGRRR